MDYSNSLRPAFLTNTASELLKQPVTALLTVSEEAAKALSNIGINSIFDLGSSQLFSAARQIKEATKVKDTEFVQRFSGDLIDTAALGKKNAEIADSPISILRQLDDTSAAFIQTALSVITIRELAAWPAYNTARAIINDAYGLSEAVIISDEERPDELIPIMRKYATERVQYDVIVMDKVLGGENVIDAIFKKMSFDKLKEYINALNLPADESAELEKFLKILPQLNKKEELLLEGAIDISDIVSAALTAKPAIGAVLTYRQSWYPQGLALGHLLHSMALAPGESTRIAMVDWARTDKGNISEQTNQAENLAADVNHIRSIGEVTSAVAKEAQSGFSESNSRATENQTGETTGSAKVDVNIKLPSLEELGDAIFNNKNLSGGAGVTTGSKGTSKASSTNVGWASSNSSSIGERNLDATMKQNINDKTQQASNSVRNRRATTVKETSQKENETLSTRVVTNYNHMHALTVQYFEVVQIYKVLLELSKVTPCLFLPMKLVTFTEEVIRRYKNVIANAALIPEVGALSFLEPDHLAIQMPRKIGSWYGSTPLKEFLGYSIANQNSKTVLLPVSGLTFTYLGSADKKFIDNYSSISITEKNGKIYNYPIYTEISSEVVIPGEMTYNISLSRFSQLRNRNNIVLNGDYNGNSTDIIKISFIKKESSLDFEESFTAVLTFFSTTKEVGEGGASSELQIGGNILPEKGVAETVIFRIQSAIANNSLINHLEENALYYSTAIWNSLDAATITTMLSSYTLMGKKLIENIDPVPVSIAGNYIIFRYYGVAKDEWQTFLDDKGLYQPAPIEDIIPLPSAGVFAEAVLGRSNAAEKLDITRFWNWQDSPIPILPPEIAQLTAGGKDNPMKLDTGKLESPLINIINPPSVPDPTGLAPLYTAIANGNMFRDMSGMAQTSSLLQTALQAAQSAAANAASTSGEAQKVAANQLTDILKIAAQIAAGAMGVPTGAIGGGGNNNNTHNLPPTPSNKGANINAAKELDEKKRAAAKQNNGTKDTTDEWTPFPDQTSNPNNGLTPPPLVDAFENESVNLNGRTLGDGNPLLASSRPSFVPTSTSPWVYLTPGDVYKRINELMEDPDKLHQGCMIGGCGYAVFLHHIIKREPIRFNLFAKELFETGAGFLGKLYIKANDSLRRAKYDVFSKAYPDIPPQADWMLFSALIDSTNLVFDFNGDPRVSLPQGAWDIVLKSWYEDTGFYGSNVQLYSQLLTDINISTLKSIKMGVFTDIAMSIKVRLIDPSLSGFHEISIEDDFIIDSVKNEITFTYWTWGDPPKTITKQLDEFLDCCMGIITAEYTFTI